MIRRFLLDRSTIVRTRNIIVSTADRDLLVRLLDSARLDWRIPDESIVSLENELARAQIVETHKLPADVVAMGSTVWFRDLRTDEYEKYTLVVPAEADVLQDRISVLAPIGTALLGYRRGHHIEWQVPAGTRGLEIMKVDQAHYTSKAHGNPHAIFENPTSLLVAAPPR